jgi:type IV secretion system protein VirD4
MLGVTEKESADFFSMRSGDSTVRVNSTMTVKQTIALAQMIPQYRETDGLGRRRLLTPDEILRFPNDELLIVIRGENVLRAKKFDFTGHPFAKMMTNASIFDYRPQQKLKISQTEYGQSAKSVSEPDRRSDSQTGSEQRTESQTDEESSNRPQADTKRSAAGKLFAASKPPDEF